MNPADRLHDLFTQFPVLYAGTDGLDQTPSVHPVYSPVYLRNAFVFPMAKCDRFYAELSLHPTFRLCGYDPESGTELQVQANAEFNEDMTMVSEVLSASPVIQKRFGKDLNMYITAILTGIRVTVRHQNDEEAFVIPDPEGLFTKISFKKDNEIRDRILKLIECRAEQRNHENDDDRKLYDGALVWIAESAKEVWPRMNILPLEQSLIYETYDERETWVQRAKEKLGNLSVTKPEDLTYILSVDSLFENRKER